MFDDLASVNVAKLFDSAVCHPFNALGCRVYSIMFCSRLEAVSDVISGTVVRHIVPMKLQIVVVRDGIFHGFVAMTSNRKRLYSTKSVEAIRVDICVKFGCF